MDKYRNAVTEIQKGIEVYVKKLLKEDSKDITVNAIVKAINEDYTYDIIVNNAIYKKVKTIGGGCYINETVKVLIPQGNYSNMIIMKPVNSHVGQVIFSSTLDTMEKVIATYGGLEWDMTEGRTLVGTPTFNPNLEEESEDEEETGIYVSKVLYIWERIK